MLLMQWRSKSWLRWKCQNAVKRFVFSAVNLRAYSHLLGVGVYGMDAGAWTVFMLTFTEREKLYTLFEELTGARFTTSYTRIGGVARDVPDGWLGRVLEFCKGFYRSSTPSTSC